MYFFPSKHYFILEG